jgi:DNA-binding transcriptional LysR family regulator
MMPGLPRFLADYPDIQLHFGEGDRFVDLVREGVDCVLRVGQPADSSLVGRRIAVLAEGTFASPAYIAQFGTPRSPGDLDGHRMVGFLSSATGALLPLEFTVDGARREVTLPVTVSAAGAEIYFAAGRLGLGLIQLPRYRLLEDMAAGTMVEVLADTPPAPAPVYVLYPHSRQLSPRVRVFIDWLAAEFAARLPSAEGG